jgi:hypothetical protein
MCALEDKYKEGPKSVYIYAAHNSMEENPNGYAIPYMQTYEHENKNIQNVILLERMS